MQLGDHPSFPNKKYCYVQPVWTEGYSQPPNIYLLAKYFRASTLACVYTPTGSLLQPAVLGELHGSLGFWCGRLMHMYCLYNLKNHTETFFPVPYFKCWYLSALQDKRVFCEKHHSASHTIETSN